MGSATAYFLTESPSFDGRVLVVEPDPTYARASTTLSAASIRHQFSNPINIALSQAGTEFIQSFHELVEVNGEAPALGFRDTGYLFLATEAGMPALRRTHKVQRAAGAEVALLSPDEIGRRFQYMNTDGLAGGSLGLKHEGTLDANSFMQGYRQRARHNGAEYVKDRVVGLEVEGGKVQAARLAGGGQVGCDWLINCAGPAAAGVAAMAGLELPVEPRVRSIFVFDCRAQIAQEMPLTIDVTGVHLRREPPYFLAGGVPREDVAVDGDDFAVRREEFEEQVWPSVANRVPMFQEIGLKNCWAGHYAYNTLDQNAVIGPAEEVPNFIFANGFSGHGMQQSAGVGRGVSELVVFGQYRTLDLAELGYDRIGRGAPFTEEAII